jgi:hypothetical protein
MKYDLTGFKGCMLAHVVRLGSMAWCELYLLFGNLFRKLDMEPYETTYVICTSSVCGSAHLPPRS